MAASGIVTFEADMDRQIIISMPDRGITHDREAVSGGDSSSPMLVNAGPGLPPLPKKLVLKIKANEFVDFAEFPLRRGSPGLSHMPSKARQLWCKLQTWSVQESPSRT